jgi:hypothetical protein
MWHHTLSLIGIGYQMHHRIGGGIMVRLLIGLPSGYSCLIVSDCFTYLLIHFEKLFSSNSRLYYH